MDPNNMHVITENGEQCFLWRSNQLTYIAQDREELPLVLAKKFGPQATRLDLSYNTLTSFKNINMFTNLNELILDNNRLVDDQLDFKQNLRLKILSLNKNKLNDLSKLINLIGICFPNLEFLSLIGNPLCPTPIMSPRDGASTNSPSAEGADQRRNGEQQQNGADLVCDKVIRNQSEQTEFAYQKYRYFIIYHLPNLRFLDSTSVSGFERDEALKRCCWVKSGGEAFRSSNQRSARDHRRQQQHHSEHNGNRTNATYNNGTSFELTIMSDHSSGAANTGVSANNGWPAQQQQQQFVRGAQFSRLSHKYTGKNSEGNRFIRNKDL